MTTLSLRKTCYVILHILRKNTKHCTQEAVLPQTDRVTRCVRRNLMYNYRNKLYHQSTTITAVESRVTVDRRVVNCHDASAGVGVVNKLHRRPSFVDDAIDLPRRITSPEFGTMLQSEVSLF